MALVEVKYLKCKIGTGIGLLIEQLPIMIFRENYESLEFPAVTE